MDNQTLLNIAQQLLSTPQGQRIAGVISEGEKILNNPPIPEIQEYEITGRVYNKSTNNSIQGADIRFISAGGKQIKTNERGEFTSKIKVPIYPPTGRVLIEPFLLISYENLVSKNIPLLTQERSIRRDIGAIGLLDIEKESKLKIGEFKQEVNDKIQQASNLVLSLPEKAIVAQRLLITKQTTKAQNILFPLIMEILLTFGVTNINDLSTSSCPTKSNLQQIINKRNRLTRQINQIYTTITINASLAFIYGRLSNVFKQLELQISSIPLPLGSPLGIGIPYNIISQLQNLEKLTEDLSEEFDDKQKQLIVSLLFLISSLVFILLLLKSIDDTIGRCAQNLIDKEDLTLEEINSQLQELTSSQSSTQVLQPSINGFNLEVIETNIKVGEISKKQAIAKNDDGVILLKGEPSFSANGQILIDELIFYIQTNDLKAF